MSSAEIGSTWTTRLVVQVALAFGLRFSFLCFPPTTCFKKRNIKTIHSLTGQSCFYFEGTSLKTILLPSAAIQNDVNFVFCILKWKCFFCCIERWVGRDGSLQNQLGCLNWSLRPCSSAQERILNPRPSALSDANSQTVNWVRLTSWAILRAITWRHN